MGLRPKVGQLEGLGLPFWNVVQHLSTSFIPFGEDNDSWWRWEPRDFDSTSDCFVRNFARLELSYEFCCLSQPSDEIHTWECWNFELLSHVGRCVDVASCPWWLSWEVTILMSDVLLGACPDLGEGASAMMSMR